MRNLNIGWIFIGGLILLTISCVKDDMSDCDTGGSSGGGIIETNSRILSFETIPHKYKFETIAENLRLYLYDEDLFLLNYYDITVQELAANDYKVTISDWKEVEDERLYHIMGVLNYTEHYEIAGEEHLERYETRIARDENNETEEDLNHIFVGYINIDPITKTVYEYKMLLEKLTNRIHLTVEFVDFELPDNSNLTAHIIGSNAEYNYLNHSLEYTSMIYHPCIYGPNDDSKFKFEITTGKLYMEDDLELLIELYNPNGIRIEHIDIPLTEKIAETQDDNGYYLYNTDEKLKEEDEYYLNIVIGANFQIIEFNINDWHLVVDPGIDL
ncbi:MAG: FimB/Mfa2 family fimbrial subunit [Tannerellaceae bacterium]|nr:FimB/Mfa2 family fimbrial subunit [Tannerellaceae bacterium]